MKEKIDQIQKGAISSSSNSSTKTGEQSALDSNHAQVSEEMRRQIQKISNSIQKNDESIQKITKEKKSFDNILVDFQREVIESQTTIWRELHNVRNILSTGKAPSN